MSNQRPNLAVANSVEALKHIAGATHTLKRLLIRQTVAALPDSYSLVLRLLTQNSVLDSCGLHNAMSCKQNHAATLLKEMYELGLLEREAMTTGDGRYYAYRLSDIGEWIASAVKE